MPASPDIRERKRALRNDLRAGLKRISLSERAIKSDQACKLLLQQGIWQRSRSVLFYSALSDELDLSMLWKEAISQKKVVTLPRYSSEEEGYVACCITCFEQELSPGRFGLLEPGSGSRVFPLNQLDLVLVPGVAFDMDGRRLGRGKGYYDRLLETVRGARCGVGFDEQVKAELPVEPHDIVLNYILTPTRWLAVTQSPGLE